MLSKPVFPQFTSALPQIPLGLPPLPQLPKSKAKKRKHDDESPTFTDSEPTEEHVYALAVAESLLTVKALKAGENTGAGAGAGAGGFGGAGAGAGAGAHGAGGKKKTAVKKKKKSDSETESDVDSSSSSSAAAEPNDASISSSSSSSSSAAPPHKDQPPKKKRKLDSSLKANPEKIQVCFSIRFAAESPSIESNLCVCFTDGFFCATDDRSVSLAHIESSNHLRNEGAVHSEHH